MVKKYFKILEALELENVKKKRGKKTFYAKRSKIKSTLRTSADENGLKG